MIYNLLLSKGQTIKIDEEDLQKIRENISSTLIQVKQGIFNPSFMVMIVPTNEQEFLVKPKIELESGVAKVLGEEKVKALSDLMGSEVKKLTN